MKRLLLAISVVALVLLPMGCVDVESMTRDAIEGMLEELTVTYTIKVSGNIGSNFTGQYDVVSAEFDPETWVDFNSDSYEVEGQIPPAGYIEYTTDEAISVVGVFQKQGEDDELLMVELWRATELVDSSETTAPWGAVLVAAFP
jgi:hypothetical protein